jgi:hypothetical protein
MFSDVSEEHTASNFRVTIWFMWMIKLWGMCRLYGKTGENLAHKSHGRKRKKALVSANMNYFHNGPFNPYPANVENMVSS